jgi:hypothetical protein
MYQYTAKYGNENYGSERWVDHPIDLTGSRNKSSWLLTSQIWQVSEIKVGDCYLPSGLVPRIPAKPVPVTKAPRRSCKSFTLYPLNYLKMRVFI